MALDLSGRNLTNGLPGLAPLANHGGFVPTMPPLPESPALNAGDDLATNLFIADARGFPRLSGPHVDLGAAEANYRPVVTSTAGSGPGSLRWAIQFADVGARITFAPNLNGQTIVLDDGDIALDKSLDVDASALPDGVTLNASFQNRFFDVVNPAATNVLTALTLIDGETSDGAAIYSRGHLTLNRCNLSNNRGHVGAAIYILQNQVTLNNCVLTNNEAAYGGAIMNWGTLLADDATFAGNHAGYTGGGAIQNAGNGLLELNQ